MSGSIKFTHLNLLSDRFPKLFILEKSLTETQDETIIDMTLKLDMLKIIYMNIGLMKLKALVAYMKKKTRNKE